MVKVTVYFSDHHVHTARACAIIAAQDWACVRAVFDNGGHVTKYDGEHAKNCTECQSSILMELGDKFNAS